MDYSSFFYSIAGCSATIIAIIGGLIASKLISISADRDNILDKIKEINDELNMKTKQHDDIIEKLDDDDALDFVRDNVSMLVDHRSRIVDFYILVHLIILHKISFCIVHCRTFIALRYKRRFTLRFFNIGCKQRIESGFTKTLLHGSDTKELLFIWIKSCSDL